MINFSVYLNRHVFVMDISRHILCFARWDILLSSSGSLKCLLYVTFVSCICFVETSGMVGK